MSTGRRQRQHGPAEVRNGVQRPRAHVWAGVGAIVIGGALLVVGGKRRKQRPRADVR